MPGGKGNIKPSDNPKPFNSEQGKSNINKNGRPLSFKKRYAEIQQSGGVIWMDANKVKKRTKDGKEQVGFELTKRDTILARLDRIVGAAKNDAVALNAIKFLWEQYDGKANQTIEGTVSTNVVIDLIDDDRGES